MLHAEYFILQAFPCRCGDSPLVFCVKQQISRTDTQRKTRNRNRGLFSGIIDKIMWKIASKEFSSGLFGTRKSFIMPGRHTPIIHNRESVGANNQPANRVCTGFLFKYICSSGGYSEFPSSMLCILFFLHTPQPAFSVGFFRLTLITVSSLPVRFSSSSYRQTNNL